MNRSLGIPTKVVAGIAMCIALSISTSCEYFDPLDPFNRGLTDTAITWEKFMGDNGEDRGMSVEQTIDGGYIITGYTQRLPVLSDYDVQLIKTDSLGNVEWDKKFGGTGDDRGYCVHQTTDGGYIVSGYTNSKGAGSGDVWLIKTDPSGVIEWDYTFGGPNWDMGLCVQCTDDGGYIITGETESYGSGKTDVWLIKTDESGGELWSNTFGDIYWDYGNCVRQTTDGGYIIGGVIRSTVDYNYDNAFLIKTDESGDELWSEKFGTNSDIDKGTCVLQTSDEGYVLVGETRSFGAGDFDAWMIKTDASGEKQWDTTFGEGAYDRADCIQPTVDGGYIIAGMTRSSSFPAIENNVWIIKTDASGEEQWNKIFGGSGNDGAYAVQQTEDGGYIMTGYTNSFAGGDNIYLIYYKH